MDVTAQRSASHDGTSSTVRSGSDVRRGEEERKRKREILLQDLQRVQRLRSLLTAKLEALELAGTVENGSLSGGNAAKLEQKVKDPSKRLPKANQVFRSDEFLLEGDKLPVLEKTRSRNGSLKRSMSMREGERQKVQNGGPVSTAAEEGLRQITAVVKKLLTEKNVNAVFGEPVDPVKLQIPDYFTIVKKPMDLGTIVAWLTGQEVDGIGKAYKHPEEVAMDVRLTFANCMTYNPPGNYFHDLALQCQQSFERDYKKVLQRMEKVEQRQAGQVYSENGKVPGQRKHQGGGRRGRGGGSKEGAKARRTERRIMTEEEKAQLVEQIGDKLHPDDMHEVEAIIARRQSLPENGELEIDKVNNETLWELEEFVTNALRHRHRDKIGGGQKQSESRNEDHSAAAEENQVSGDKKAKTDKETSGNTSASSSDGSGSTSGNESGSETSNKSNSDVGEVQSKKSASQGSAMDPTAGSEAPPQRKSSAPPLRGGGEANRLGGKVVIEERAKEASMAQATVPSEKPNHQAAPTSSNPSFASSALAGQETEAAETSVPSPDPDKPMSEAAMRVALLRGKYKASISNAKTKTLVADKIGPKVLEALEQKQKEERDRLAREAKLAEEAQKKKEAELLAGQKRKLEEEREAERKAREQMKRTVDIDDNVYAVRGFDEHAGGDSPRPFPEHDILAELGLRRRSVVEDDEEESEEERDSDDEDTLEEVNKGEEEIVGVANGPGPVEKGEAMGVQSLQATEV